MEITLLDKEIMVKVGKALSSEVRVEILKLLCSFQLNINEIAERLDIPPSSAAMNVKVLEEAGLIETELQPGIRGSMKLCRKAEENLNIALEIPRVNEANTIRIDMPIGNYVDYKVTPTCGMVDENGSLDVEDEPRCFYNPSRTQAKLLWFGAGYVEYRFPNTALVGKEVKEVRFSAEICSEDHDYNMDYPSDITLWINGMDAGTFACPGDFGGRRGKLNPGWWPDVRSQYGNLKTWSLNKKGTFLDRMQTSRRKLSEYRLDQGEFISVRFGNSEDAVHIGGMNLFGDCFGDHPQNIVMEVEFI